jgi:hypothetical protein
VVLPFDLFKTGSHFDNRIPFSVLLPVVDVTILLRPSGFYLWRSEFYVGPSEFYARAFRILCCKKTTAQRGVLSVTLVIKKNSF